jgi:hypothetical protein
MGETALEPSAPTEACRCHDGLWSDLARWSALVLLGLIGGATALIAARRVAGALQTPLPPALLTTVGVSLVAAAATFRLLWEAHVVRPVRLGRPATPLVATGVVLVFAAALSLPGTAWPGLIGLWLLVAGEECWAWGRLARRRRRRPVAPRTTPGDRPAPIAEPASPGAGSPAPGLSGAASAPASAESAAGSLGPPPEADVVQQFTRSRAADGSEAIAGWLRVPLAAGQRTTSAHVAFCPPFPKTPYLEVEQLDGPEVRVKTGQLLAHGVRFDLKLSQAWEEPVGVLLQFSARSAT